MLKKHKNTVFQEIEKVGFNPYEFEFVQANENHNLFKIKEADLWFNFIQLPESFDSFKFSYTRFAPKPQVVASSQVATFEKTLLNFNSWLKREAFEFIYNRDGDDLFENMKERTEFNFDNDVNEKFSLSEIEFIIPKLDQLKLFIAQSFEATAEQNLQINLAIEHLAESVKLQSKFDWRGIFVSTFLSIITTLTLDTEKGTLLWNYISSLFAHIQLLQKPK